MSWSSLELALLVISCLRSALDSFLVGRSIAEYPKKHLRAYPVSNISVYAFSVAAPSSKAEAVPNINMLVGLLPSISSLRVESVVFLISLGLTTPSNNSRYRSTISFELRRLLPISSTSKLIAPILDIRILCLNCLTAGPVPESKLATYAPSFLYSLVTAWISSSSGLPLRAALRIPRDSKASCSLIGNVVSKNCCLNR